MASSTGKRKWLINKTATVGCGFALSILVGIGVASYLQFLNFKKADEWVDHTQAVINQNQEILNLVTDAETGQRGYLLTGNELYLQPYHRAMDTIGLKINLMRQLTADNPNQQRRIDELRALIEAKLPELKQTIYLRQNKGLAEALQLVKTDRGMQLMAEIRQRSAQIAMEENRLLQARTQQAEAQAQFTTYMLVLSSVVGFGLVSIAGIAIARQLTERRSAEEMAKESELRFRILSEGMPQLVWSGFADGTIDYSNKRWEQYTGLTPHEVDGDGWIKVLHPEDRENTTAAWKLAADTTQEYEIEQRLCGVDGKYRWFLTRALPHRNETGQIVKWYGTCTNIEDQKKAQEALQTGEERLRLAVESTNLGTWDWNLTTGVINLSDRFKVVLGVLPEAAAEADYQMCLSLVHPEDRERVDRVVQKALDPSSTGEYITEYRVLRPDGTIRWIEAQGRVLRQNQQAYRFIGTVLNITERKLAQEQIQAALDEKVVLLKEIHHRVKNNLQIVTSLLNLQSSRLEEPQIQKILQECQNRVSSMALIHEQLYQSEDLAKIDFTNYVHNLVNNLCSSYDVYNSAIQIKMNIDDIYLSIDTAIPCGLILNELVSNALKYAFPLEQKGDIKIDFHLNDDNYLQLSVKDNGVGISPELDIDKTNSLGLQLVKALTRQLQGTLMLNRDMGSDFQIVFENK